MTREEFKGKVNNLSCHLCYPVLNDLHDIDDHDAEQRHVIAELSALIGTIRGLLGIQPLRNTDDISAEEHSMEIIQQVNRMIEQQAQEIARLREAVQIALINLRAWNGEDTWPLYKQSPEIKKLEQALKEAGK